jgi:hypothetical protein
MGRLLTDRSLLKRSQKPTFESDIASALATSSKARYRALSGRRTNVGFQRELTFAAL